MERRTAIDDLMTDYGEVKEILTNTHEVSLLNNYSNTFRKVLMISCGSFFEEQITALLRTYAEFKSKGDRRLSEFIYNQGLAARYHTLFDWGKKNQPDQPTKNASKFFKLFGSDFDSFIKNELKEENTSCGLNSENVEDSIKAFLEIGHLRNILVHNNFAEYTYEQKTPEDIHELYKKALLFLEYLNNKFLS